MSSGLWLTLGCTSLAVMTHKCAAAMQVTIGAQPFKMFFGAVLRDGVSSLCNGRKACKESVLLHVKINYYYYEQLYNSRTGWEARNGNISYVTSAGFITIQIRLGQFRGEKCCCLLRAASSSETQMKSLKALHELDVAFIVYLVLCLLFQGYKIRRFFINRMSCTIYSTEFMAVRLNQTSRSYNYSQPKAVKFLESLITVNSLSTNAESPKLQSRSWLFPTLLQLCLLPPLCMQICRFLCRRSRYCCCWLNSLLTPF